MSLVVQHVQTIFALVRQAKTLGFTPADIGQIVTAYTFAADHFAGYYRPGWKPFVNHLCGMASAALRHGGDARQAVVSVLHSIYVVGREPSRSTVRAQVGEAAEATIHRYSKVKTSYLEKNAETLSPEDREILFLRLCNEFDDMWDAAPKFAPTKELWLGLPENPAGRARIKELCVIAGSPGLAADYEAVFADYDKTGDLPKIDGHSNSFRPKLPLLTRLLG